MYKPGTAVLEYCRKKSTLSKKIVFDEEKLFSMRKNFFDEENSFWSHSHSSHDPVAKDPKDPKDPIDIGPLRSAVLTPDPCCDPAQWRSVSTRRSHGHVLLKDFLNF